MEKMIVVGGTDNLHRATIARSKSVEGPWTPNPNNPMLFNGQYGVDNLTVQSTGHATIFDTPNGDFSYISYLARRKINGKSRLGRETFVSHVDWIDGRPRVNGGEPILLSDKISRLPPKTGPSKFRDNFEGHVLNGSWYTLRSPYNVIYGLSPDNKTTACPKGNGTVLKPNVFGLSDRDVPAAILRKQKSLNVTFSARIHPLADDLGTRQTIGISAYLSELQHQDIGLTGRKNSTGTCLYTSATSNGTIKVCELQHSGRPRHLSLSVPMIVR